MKIARPIALAATLLGLQGTAWAAELSTREAALPEAPATGESHTELSTGLGVLTSGIGLTLGHRAASGLRVEGAVGTLIVATGASVGLGCSLRLVESARHTLEVPLLAEALGFRLSPSEGAHTEYLPLVGAATGLDWLIGDRHDDVSDVVLSLRGGAMAITGAFDDGPLPIFQLSVGATF